MFADFWFFFTFALILFVGILFLFDGILRVSVSILDIFLCIYVCGNYALSDSIVSVFVGLLLPFVALWMFFISLFPVCGHFMSF